MQMTNRERYGAISAIRDAKLAREHFTGVSVDQLTGEYRAWWEGRNLGLFANLLTARKVVIAQFAQTVVVVG